MSTYPADAFTRHDNSQREIAGSGAKPPKEPKRMRQRTPRAERAAAVRLAREAVWDAGGEVTHVLGCVLHSETGKQMATAWRIGLGGSGERTAVLGDMLVMAYRVAPGGAVHVMWSVDAFWRVKREPAMGRRLARAIRVCAAWMRDGDLEAICAVDMRDERNHYHYIRTDGATTSAPPNVAGRELVRVG